MIYIHKVRNELEQNLNKYRYVICVSINRVKSKQIQDIRKVFILIKVLKE